jgi:hypothetical protein
MKKLIMYLMVAFAVSSAVAHEMTPTYPSLRPSHLQGVWTTTMEMFNKRQDVEYYEIGVFTKDWEPIPFVSSYKVVHLTYLGHLSFDIYIREKDKERATYICSRSKLRKEDAQRTAVSSRICSKIK